MTFKSPSVYFHPKIVNFSEIGDFPDLANLRKIDVYLDQKNDNFNQNFSKIGDFRIGVLGQFWKEF